jgi:hypothetical protein
MSIDPEFPKNHQVIGNHKHAEAGAVRMKIESEKRIKIGNQVQIQK